MGQRLDCLTDSRLAPDSVLEPTLVFGIGNPSRGDDALGPLLIERLQRLAAVGELPGVALLTDFQLQIEHALDMLERRRVIFVDAAIGLQNPWTLTRVMPSTAAGWTTHRVTPAALLHLYQSLYGPPPRVELLAIGAEQFELGAPISESARSNLEAAMARLLPTLGEARRAKRASAQQP